MIAYALRMVINIIQFLIFARIIISWLPINKKTTFVKYIYILTEPILGPIRQLLQKTPLSGTMLDFSPLIAFLLLSFVAGLLV